MKRVYLGNLSFAMTEDEINDVCSEVGTVVSVKVIQNPENGRSRGFAFVEMETEEQAAALIEKLNDQELNGRKVMAAIAREKQRNTGGYKRNNFRRDRENNY
ncbi:MAG TPA: RNA-binding protein [Spirochaetia bacterium]|nr:MAG: hypothetical protein A2Y41_13795 [Spirochaetes bacterium GWB1_36_13]HCL55719.1 RNA-binding protein [Spirochaetia bacterium]